MNIDVLNLPFAIQLSLASGYAAYIAAFTGLRERHHTIDTAFATLVFGVLATGILTALAPLLGRSGSAILAFLGTVIAGLVWRKFGRTAWRLGLRKLDVSWSDDDPSALATLMSDTSYNLTQVAVLLDDGTWLRCDNTAQFHDAPHAPCVIGSGGDIALYLTHEERLGKEAEELKSVRDDEWGDRITYVPANRVTQITFRMTKR